MGLFTKIFGTYSERQIKRIEPIAAKIEALSDTYLHNTVLLSDGRKGEVIMTNQMVPSKPGVMIDNEYIDLTKTPSLKIESIL